MIPSSLKVTVIFPSLHSASQIRLSCSLRCVKSDTLVLNLRPEYYTEKEAATKLLLSDIISEVENGTKDYDAALKEAYTKIYQTINPAYVPNEEIGIDRIYLDIPSADTVMFTQARKLLKEAQTRSVQK